MINSVNQEVGQFLQRPLQSVSNVVKNTSISALRILIPENLNIKGRITVTILYGGIFYSYYDRLSSYPDLVPFEHILERLGMCIGMSGVCLNFDALLRQLTVGR